MPETTIEWATHVWNPFTGCDRVSPGCARCYALTAAASLKRREQGRIDKAAAEDRPAPKVRYQRDGDSKTSGPGFGFTVHDDKLADPEHFPAGARVFVNSMSDVFHDGASDLDIARLFGAAGAQPWANFLILTKRPERMHALLNHPEFVATTMRATGQVGLDWPLPNIWLGVSIENRRFVHRADLLRETPAAVRFVSAEPLLGPLVPRLIDFGSSKHLDRPGPCGEHGCALEPIWVLGDDLLCDRHAMQQELDLLNIDWLIVGGESGSGHRPIDRQWVRDLRDTCGPACGCRDDEPCRPDTPAVECRRKRPGLTRTAFFFKQWGGRRAKEGGRELDGRTWGEIPEAREG